MTYSLDCAMRPGQFSKFFLLLVVPLWIATWGDTARAQSPPTIVRVEQDWELVVGIPDPKNAAPQIVCVISPQADVAGLYAAFELNQRSQPSFTPGGMQLQVWEGESYVKATSPDKDDLLQQPEERIAWTQSMHLVDGFLIFRVSDGTSQTWGAFGGTWDLRAAVWTSAGNLNAYDPAVSVANSGAGYASNRVRSLVLKRSRQYTETGSVLEDTNEKVVYPRE